MKLSESAKQTKAMKDHLFHHSYMDIYRAEQRARNVQTWLGVALVVVVFVVGFALGALSRL